MTFEEMRTEIDSIGREPGLSPTESRLLDVVNELIITVQNQWLRIHELASRDVSFRSVLEDSKHKPNLIHRVTSNFDFIDHPSSVRSDCGVELTLPRRVPVEQLILGQRIPSFAAQSESDRVCYFCSNIGPLRDNGIWESYWRQPELHEDGK